MFANFFHPREGPELGSPFLAQLRHLPKVIAVHVRRQHGVDPFQSQMLAHADDRLVQHLRLNLSTIDDKPATAIGDEDVEIRIIVGPAKLVDVRQHLPNVRHLGRSRGAILMRAREREDRIAAEIQFFEASQLLLELRQLRHRALDRRTV